MGYLSQLEVNSAISVANIHNYCRGGSNDAAYDQYLKQIGLELCQVNLELILIETPCVFVVENW